MHPLLFSLKRTHLKSLAMCRGILGKFPLTPARYDMLAAARKYAGPQFTQSDLRRLLGVNRATTSRMARSLEKLGYIERKEAPFDRRQLLVTLTPQGTRIFETIEYDVVDYGMIDFGVTCAFSFKWYSDDAVSELLDLDDRLHHARAQLWDTACFRFDGWHPDS